MMFKYLISFTAKHPNEMYKTEIVSSLEVWISRRTAPPRLTPLSKFRVKEIKTLSIRPSEIGPTFVSVGLNFPALTYPKRRVHFRQATA